MKNWMEQYRDYLMRAAKAGIVIGMVAMFVWFWRKAYPSTVFYPDASFWQKGNLVLTFFYTAILILCLKLYQATKIGFASYAEIAYSMFLSSLITNAAAYIQLSLMSRTLIALLPILLLILCQTLFAVGVSLLLHYSYRILYPMQQVLLIAGKPDQKETGEYKGKQKWKIFKIMTEGSCEKELYSAIVRADTVLIGAVSPEFRISVMHYCRLIRKPCYVKPTVEDVLVNHASHMQMLESPVYFCGNGNISLEKKFLKRTMDLVIALPAFLLLLPVMFVVALAIRLEDGGPIFYRQIRLTREGRKFSIWKFRSMVVNAEAEGVKVASRDDNRITKVGSIIRRFRLDELPQLINVVTGSMSIVGPRPERPEIAEQYEKENPLFAIRLNVKAGLTGYAQVYGKYNSSLSDKLLLDTIYIERFSLLQDMIIMLLTVKILFLPDSTEGFEDHQIKYH